MAMVDAASAGLENTPFSKSSDNAGTDDNGKASNIMNFCIANLLKFDVSGNRQRIRETEEI
jgi:hypothetical protein